MRFAIFCVACVLVLGYIEADQRRRPAVTKGITECRPARRRGQKNYGTSELKEARIFREDGKTELELTEVDGSKVFKLKSGAKYKFRVKFVSKRYPEGFGALPKYFGVKITEEYTKAAPGQQQIFQATFGKPILGKQECSPAFFGRSKDSDGCKWLTKDSEASCPLNQNPDEDAEIEFLFNVPNFPDTATNSSFRLIPTEEPVSRGGCEKIGQPGGTETTIDVDMICFKYPTFISRK